MVIEPAFGTFGSVGRCQVLLENEIISISIKKEAWSALKMSWYMAALTVDFRKHSGQTPADDMAAQIITDCGNLTLDKSIRFVKTFPFTLGHINVALQNGYKSVLQFPCNMQI